MNQATTDTIVATPKPHFWGFDVFKNIPPCSRKRLTGLRVDTLLRTLFVSRDCLPELSQVDIVLKGNDRVVVFNGNNGDSKPLQLLSDD